jgi:hypothetical protein
MRLCCLNKLDVFSHVRPHDFVAAKYLVIDDLAVELQERPIFVPVPSTVLRDEATLKKFAVPHCAS